MQSLANPCALIGSFLVRILQFGPFHGPIRLFLFQSKAGKFNICNQDSKKKSVKIVILQIESTSRS